MIIRAEIFNLSCQRLLVLLVYKERNQFLTNPNLIFIVLQLVVITFYKGVKIVLLHLAQLCTCTYARK